MKRSIRALVIEDSILDAQNLARVISDAGYDLYAERIETPQEMDAALDKEKWDLVLSDFMVPQFCALDALHIVKRKGLDVPFIIISGDHPQSCADEIIRAGVHAIIDKGNLDPLIPAINRELEEARIRLRKKFNLIEQRQAEEKYRHLTESITDLFFALDKNLHCTYWNKTCEQFTTIPSKSALGKHFQDIMGKYLDNGIEQVFIDVQKNGISSNFYTEYINKNVKFIYEWNVYPAENGVTILARDITRQLQAQELQNVTNFPGSNVDQRQDLHVLGLLTSGVAHEVRNPLNAISVVTEALFMDLGDDSKYRSYKEHIQTHVERLTNLMQDLLELGKPIEKSNLQIIDLSDFIRNSVYIWNGTRQGPRHEIKLDFTDSLESVKVRGDKVKLQQVLFNLLDNAAQHSPTNTPIRIAAHATPTHTILKIIDQGTGIPPEHLPRIFDPFFTTRKKGTGLGLSIVKHIVDVHRGKITIQNNQNTPGTRVEISLPLASIQAPVIRKIFTNEQLLPETNKTVSV